MKYTLGPNKHKGFSYIFKKYIYLIRILMILTVENDFAFLTLWLFLVIFHYYFDIHCV